MLGPARFLRNALSRDPDRRLVALKFMADWLLPDYRLTWSQIDWWQDPEFNAYLDSIGERKCFNAHRRFMVWQLTKLVQDIEGDTAECGVFQGHSSRLICKRLNRTHHLFDSFEGLSEPGQLDGDYWRKGSLSTPEEPVKAALNGYDFRVHKGWIPDRFNEVEDRRFAFVHIDVDIYQPTKDSIEFFYPRLNRGAVLLCDDYGQGTCPGATRAIDEFMTDKPEPMIALDAGGGFFIKR